MKDGLIISLLSIIPKKPVARFMGFSARLELPRFMHKALVRYFIWKYDVNIEECQGEITDFSSLGDFFIRPLKDGRRLIDQKTEHITSPVDGRVHAFGKIKNGLFYQSEAQQGSVRELLGEMQIPNFPENLSHLDMKHFDNGSFIIIYLSPQDYHRVHSHDGGKIELIRYLPGKLWPVFPAATRKIPHLFDRNERLVFGMTHEYGVSFSALIGAFGVGRMSTIHSPIVTNSNGPVEESMHNIAIERGSEIGRFELGSTVVLVYPDSIDVDWQVKEQQKVTLGEVIAVRK